MANPSQLFLLADHIKLSLLEGQRENSLLIDSNTKKADISNSLKTLQDGIVSLEAEGGSQSESRRSQIHDLRQQYNSLIAQYQSGNGSKNEDPPKLHDDPQVSTNHQDPHQHSKLVRFTDHPDESEPAKRYALMPYKDDPEDNEAPDQNHWDNQQIHTYHKSVLQDQDQQLDRLGTSISRQRELSIQIGSELDDQVELLDDMDERVTRHQSQLDRAKTRLGRFAKKAKDNLSLTIIGILVFILILLLIILK